MRSSVSPITSSQGSQSTVGASLCLGISMVSRVWSARSSGDAQLRRRRCGAHSGITDSSNSAGPGAALDRHEAHRHVDAAALQVEHLQRGRQAHVDPRMVGGEARQPRDQPEGGEARRAGDRDLAQRRRGPQRARWRRAAAPGFRPPRAAARAPASVSASARWRRSNSSTPRLASSCWICRLTADWVRKSSPAACVKLSVRAAASKLRSSSSGGRSARGAQGVSHSLYACNEFRMTV